MRTSLWALSLTLVAGVPLGCTVYTSAERQDGVLYVTGHDTYFGIVTVPFVRRCKEVDAKGLVCRELEVEEGEVPIPAPSSTPKVAPTAPAEPAAERPDCAALQGRARQDCLARPPATRFEEWPD